MIECFKAIAEYCDEYKQAWHGRLRIKQAKIQNKLEYILVCNFTHKKNFKTTITITIILTQNKVLPKYLTKNKNKFSLTTQATDQNILKNKN